MLEKITHFQLSMLPALYLSALPFVLLAVIALWEYAYPLRKSSQPRWYRWLNMAGARLVSKYALSFFAIVAFAELCREKHWGLFNQFEIPTWAMIIITIVLLDLSAYIIHAYAHRNQLLWRAHRTHHLDTEYDITTALRTHPLDDLLNTLAEFAFIIIFGLSPEAMAIYWVICGGIVKFSHANVLISDKLDRVLRWFIVTPNMHRIHHSAERAENDSNFATHFTIWDRLFGTYREYPSLPHDQMKIGLHEFRHQSEIRIDKLLLRPFHNKE